MTTPTAIDCINAALNGEPLTVCGVEYAPVNLTIERLSDSPRALLLDRAKQIISSDRNSTYGEPEDNLGRIANLWATYLERPISARDVAMLMILVKVAREIHNPHDDNPLDIAGYAALAHEVTP